jgi:hypothetical protein
MSNNFDSIAAQGSGARLNRKLYRKWYWKVKRHDQLEKIVREALVMFKITQCPEDYPSDHWSRRAEQILKEKQPDSK